MGEQEQLQLAIDTNIVSDLDKIADLLTLVAKEIREGVLVGEIREQGEVVLTWNFA